MHRISIHTLATAILGAAMLALPCKTSATILVKDSFSTTGYSLGEPLKDLSVGDSTGFTSQKWGASSSSGVFFVNDGLTLPGDFIVSSLGNSIGLGKFTGTNPTASKWGRRITRTIDSGVIPANGTYFVRMAMEISEDAEKFLRPRHWESLGLTSVALVNTDGIDSFPDSGVHFGFMKTGSAGSTGTDIVVTGRGVTTPKTLVETVEAGKTYLLVAKVEIDSAGSANVYALAGKADDLSLRKATLPETPSVTASVGTSALRHLCLSGVYFNSVDSNRYASFDELAIGESLDDVWGFINSSAPVVYSTEATDIGETGFTANGNLAQCGSPNPQLFIDISDDAGETWSEISMGTYSAIGDVSYSATGLLSGSTYSWRFRAVNSSAASTSEVQVVTLTGAPALGVPAAAVSGTSATLSISLETPGLSGADDTTVTLWFAEQGSALALQKTFATVTSSDDFEETIDNLTYGKTYIYAFKASVPYNGGTLDAWSSTNTVEILGAIAWTNGGNDGNWHNAGNWSPSVAPSALLEGSIQEVGGEISASSDGAISNLYVNTGAANPVTIDFGGNSLSATYVGVGNIVRGSSLTLQDGTFDFGTTRIGGSSYGQSSLTVAANAKLTGSDIFLGYDAANALSNSLTFASGSETDISGTLGLRSGHYNHAEVESGASVNVGGILLRSSGVTMTVDGGAVTNNGTTVVLSSNLMGTIEDPVVLEFKNGATAKLKGRIAINAARNNAANHAYVHGELRILDGSSVECGDSIYIDNNAQTVPIGPNDDQASNGAKIIVSNATLIATTISICNDGRHHGDELLIAEDNGHTTKVATSGNVRVAAVGPNNSAVVNYDNRISLEGGELAIGETLHVGDNGPYYANHTNNHVSIGLTNSKVTAKNLSVYGVGYVKFRIPESGFDEVPMQISGTASFGAIPQRDSVNIYEADEWTPVSQVRIDATDFIGEQTLITAASITDLTADRVIVETPRARKTAVTLTGTTLSVKVSQSATVLLLR